MRRSPDILWQSDSLLAPQSFIFDWEGTLASSQNFLKGCYQKVFEHYNATLPPLSVLLSLPSLQLFQHFIPHDALRATHLFEALINHDHSHASAVFTGVEDLLTTLHNLGYPLFIISNGNSQLLKTSIEKLGWTSLFKKVLGGDDFSYSKPDPEIVWQALGSVGLSPDLTTWFVGDMPIDLYCARAAGCSAIHVVNYYQEKHLTFDEYDLVLQKTSDLKKMLTILQ